jgi:hypothetical protein
MPQPSRRILGGAQGAIEERRRPLAIPLAPQDFGSPHGPFQALLHGWLGHERRAGEELEQRRQLVERLGSLEGLRQALGQVDAPGWTLDLPRLAQHGRRIGILGRENVQQGLESLGAGRTARPAEESLARREATLAVAARLGDSIAQL